MKKDFTPFKIYRVHDGWRGLELQVATVTGPYGAGHRLADGSGLAFGCRRVVEGTLHRTPAEAYRSFIRAQRAQIKSLEEEIGGARKSIERANRELEKL